MADDKLVRQTVYYPTDTRQQLKLLAAKYDMTISQVATKAVELLLKQEETLSDSKAKLDTNAPVDYCYAKFVKKAPNSKPGMVIYSNFQTIIVK